MARPSARISVTTGVASCVLLLPGVGCRRPSADLALPGEVNPNLSDPFGKQAECKAAAAPRPPAGSADDHDPPELIGARFVARDRVQLTFSEALAPVDAVNPRQFRISHAYSMIDGDSGSGQGYATGYYYDLSGGDSYEQPTVVVALEAYAEQPEVLALTLNRPVPTDLCEQLVDARTNLDELASQPGALRRGDVGLFLHYTSRGSDGVRDRVNNPLADIGADWALSFGSRHKTVYGTEPVMRLDLLPRLACPDPSMGAIGGPPGPV